MTIVTSTRTTTHFILFEYKEREIHFLKKSAQKGSIRVPIDTQSRGDDVDVAGGICGHFEPLYLWPTIIFSSQPDHWQFIVFF